LIRFGSRLILACERLSFQRGKWQWDSWNILWGGKFVCQQQQQQTTGVAGIDWQELRQMYLATPLRSPEAVQRKNLGLYNPVARLSPGGETPVRSPHHTCWKSAHSLW